VTEYLRMPFRFALPFRAAGLPLGVRPESCEVIIDDVRLSVTFGPWSLSTPRSNVIGATVTGPYRLAKVIGPPHLSFRDGGITFATNADQGVCLHFAEPVPALLPVPVLRHPAATLTVEHPAGLAELFEAASGVHALGDLDHALLIAHDELSAMSASELRTRAKDLGIRGTSSMTKAALLTALAPDAVGAASR